MNTGNQCKSSPYTVTPEEQFFSGSCSSVPGVIFPPSFDLLPLPSLILYTDKAGFIELPHSVFVDRCQSTRNHTIATVAVIFDNTLKGHHHVFCHKLTWSIYNDCFIQKCSTRNSAVGTGSLVFCVPHFRISVRTFERQIQVAHVVCPFVLCLFALMPFGNLHHFLIYAPSCMVQHPLAACTLEHCWVCVKLLA